MFHTFFLSVVSFVIPLSCTFVLRGFRFQLLFFASLRTATLSGGPSLQLRSEAILRRGLCRKGSPAQTHVPFSGLLPLRGDSILAPDRAGTFAARVISLPFRGLPPFFSLTSCRLFS